MHVKKKTQKKQHKNKVKVAQSAGAAEYTDCFSTKG